MRATGTSFKNPISEDNLSFMNVTGGLKNKNSKSKAFGDRNQTLAGPSIGIREKLTISGNKNPTTRGDTQNVMTPSYPVDTQKQLLNHHEFDVSLTQNQANALNHSSMTNDFPAGSSQMINGLNKQSNKSPPQSPNADS
jgi:hypothetical protein|tara:strand:+ start:2001 stop:2417 length:417 start_codon:yes stop_codon:yes gene_type:complete